MHLMAQQTVSLEDIYAPVQKWLTQVPAAILDILSPTNELAGDVIRYFFSGQGKLLRPALAFLGAEMKGVGSDLEARIVHLGAALEIFHSATLIHDDIIDSAYLRRNLPTINVKWGPQVAVLIGDYLQDKAAAYIYRSGNEKIISIFLQTAQTVCDGELHELTEKDNFDLTEPEYLDIVDKKTAALLAASVQSGGIVAGASPEEAEALKRFGRYFGIAFQIVDDCLDFTGREQVFGKTLGADCAAEVLTLPLIRLIHLVDERQKSRVYKIFKSEMGTEKFPSLLAMIREYGTIEYSLERAREFSDKARLELSVFPDSPAKKSLDQLVDYVLNRSR